MSTMKAIKATTYVIILTCSIFANKYVLSVLGFQFPMVFQGWQTLVGCLTFKILSIWGVGVPRITPMDWSGFVSLLPNFVLFTFCIIAGSKALASLPVIVYITAGINLIPAFSYIIDTLGRTNRLQDAQTKSSRMVPLICTLLVIVASVTLLILSETSQPFTNKNAVSDNDRQKNIHHVDDLMYGAKFWLCVHVGCGLALSLHTSGFADQRFSFTDRLFYSYAFSLVVLLPASLYLEEAFEALHFQHRRQIRFVIGSLVAALLGVILNVYQARLKEDKIAEKQHGTLPKEQHETLFKFGLIHHLGLAFCAILSTLVFETELSTPTWIISIINLSAAIPIPSHIKPDENITSNIDLSMRITNAALNKEYNLKPKNYAYSALARSPDDAFTA